MKGDDWIEKKRGFEQHMLEEDLVRERWRSGAFEGKESCRHCNSDNVWDLKKQCCQKQCHEKLNALQAFPHAAWDDISAAPLDPVKVVAARRLEIQYAEQKPVWERFSG